MVVVVVLNRESRREAKYSSLGSAKAGLDNKPGGLMHARREWHAAACCTDEGTAARHLCSTCVVLSGCDRGLGMGITRIDVAPPNQTEPGHDVK